MIDGLRKKQMHSGRWGHLREQSVCFLYPSNTTMHCKKLKYGIVFQLVIDMDCIT